MPVSNNNIPLEAHKRLLAGMVIYTRRLHRARLQAALLRGAHRACWIIGAFACVIALASITTHHAALVSGVALGALTCVVVSPVFKVENVSNAETAQRLDLAFDTHNIVASALDFAAAGNPSPIEQAVIAAGVERINSLPAAQETHDRLIRTLDPSTGSWTAPLLCSVAGLLIAAAIVVFVHPFSVMPRSVSAQGSSIAQRPDEQKPVAVATAIPTPSTPHPNGSSVQSQGGMTAAGVGTAAAHTPGSPAEGPTAASAATSSGTDASPAERGQALASAITASRSESATPTSPGAAPDPADAAPPGAANAASSSGDKSQHQESQSKQPGAGKPSGSSSAAAGGPSASAGQQQAGSQSPSGGGTPTPSGSPGQQPSQSQTSSSASPSSSSPGQSPHGGKPGDALSSDANATQAPSGKGQPGRGGTKKSRGVPPLLLGAIQSDAVASPLLNGPEQLTNTLVPPQPDPSAVAPAATEPPTASQSPTPVVDPVPVDGADQPLVARYLLSVHSDALPTDHP